MKKRALAAALALALIFCSACEGESVPEPPQPEHPQPVQPAPPPEPVPEPGPEPVVRTSTATIAAAGDVLMHIPVIKTGYDSQTGEYDFSSMFPYFGDYVAGADLAAANLETTLNGLDNGYPYQGFPHFNCPDGIVDSLKAAGFDLLLTANNHSYDTGENGFLRTQQVVEDRNLAHIGTRLEEGEKPYTIQDVNGIRVGLLCYTYGQLREDGRKAVNGLPMTRQASGLINLFDPNKLDVFYEELTELMSQMEEEGAQATVLFLHWGYEYRTTPNQYQQEMAQTLCDLGVDVIIGAHPHVVQPVELLTSETDPDHHTICLYSMGNMVSNQRRQLIEGTQGHTEDGAFFQVTFGAYSDGTVQLEDVELLPLWVNRTEATDSGRRAFEIIPLDTRVEDWKTTFGLTESEHRQAQASYERTMEIVGEGLAEVEGFLAQQPTPEGN